MVVIMFHIFGLLGDIQTQDYEVAHGIQEQNLHNKHTHMCVSMHII